MFEHHRAPAPDPILRVMQEFAEDPRPDKVDLGVGVYRTADGRTPVMRAVKAAERRVLETQQTKGYVALAGDPAFHAALGGLVLGQAVAPDRLAALATPGGTGAVRQAFELIRTAKPDATVWTSAPTWPNHGAILDTLGMPRRSYRYYSPDTSELDRDGLFQDLASVGAGDVVLLHGCCHNPTGADLSLADWQAIGRTLSQRGVLPMVDLAYQGFATGIETDVAGLRLLCSMVPEVLVTVSASKTFGLYRDRVGLLLAICGTPGAARAVQGSLAWINRQSYAFPPDHGARVVTEILSDADLRADWEAELMGMRYRIRAMRHALADALRRETNTDRFDWLRAQNGLFSRLPATADQVEALRREHAIYMVGDGRINLAGLTPDTADRTARAIASALS
ncbi:aromatic amino acid transaminase [Tropicimonas isoalkanivorans]|uniref:Aminotransferase n=1 Tax=Tropicimonas isoalkanivorans TaxID=441112 RepID=A0A1I1NXG6_9RHOB|nr:amino acid aminotransferase [Tropicimonas isoalkanivorans]SFD02391.1 aromatic amino acid aminotransferase apoenzyme [Tropicimonas isoalkanivorans]